MNPTTKRPIVTEEYNELVFVDPSPTMLRLLSPAPPKIEVLTATENGMAIDAAAQ